MNEDQLDQYPFNQPNVKIGMVGIGNEDGPGIVGIATGESGTNIGVQSIVTETYETED